MKEGDRLNSVFFAEFYCTFFSFFFFLSFCFFWLSRVSKRQNLLFTIQMLLFTYCFGIIHVLLMRSTATLYQKKVLKMDLTIPFTHLKIILLQYFQFSIFSFSISVTISSIQTYPIYFI